MGRSWSAAPYTNRSGPASKWLLTLVEQLARQRSGGFGGSRAYRVNQRATDDQWRLEGAGQSLQSDQRLEINFVVDAEDFDRLGQS
jgi:hypothetical protein